MKYKCPFYFEFQVLKVPLSNICKIQPLDLLFLVVFVTLYSSRYHLAQICRTSFNITWKKDFRHKFSFFNGFSQTPILLQLNDQNMLSVTKAFYWCSHRLGSHRGDHICRLGWRNLIALDSSPKVRRQSIPTNCPRSVLRSTPFIRWFFIKLSTFFVFISNRLISY